MKQLLPFNVSYESYALALNDVQEIVEDQRIDPFPGAPSCVAGAISFHGRVIPLIDMAKLLGFADGKVGSRQIVLTDDWGPIALGVDQVRSIINLEAAALTPVQNYTQRKYISTVINWRGSMLGLLQLDEIQATLERLCDGRGG
jgi:purine-binding chemotaxis protein CheW